MVTGYWINFIASISKGVFHFCLNLALNIVNFCFFCAFNNEAVLQQTIRGLLVHNRGSLVKGSKCGHGVRILRPPTGCANLDCHSLCLRIRLLPCKARVMLMSLGLCEDETRWYASNAEHTGPTSGAWRGSVPLVSSHVLPTPSDFVHITALD